MLHETSTTALLIFLVFVATVLGLSFHLGRKTKSAKAYFAAHGQIHWFVNGVAFAGDYLSAASFLGICGMIAFFGYDGFLYSIGYLAGWVVALFVIAEPIKRLGKYTFADALDSQFHSRGIKLTAAISTLVVSIFYLIPQMVGAGALVKPLLGLPHGAGVLLVGVTVTLIVVTAGMVSTTWVQFIKGAMLVAFCVALTLMILQRGLTVTPPNATPDSVVRTASPESLAAVGLDAPGGGASDEVMSRAIDQLKAVQALPAEDERKAALTSLNARLGAAAAGMRGWVRVALPAQGPWKDKPYARVQDVASGRVEVWRLSQEDNKPVARLTQVHTETASGAKLVNGLPQGKGPDRADLKPIGTVVSLAGGAEATGPLGPVSFVAAMQGARMLTWAKDTLTEASGDKLTIYYPLVRSGEDLLTPGGSPTFKSVRGDKLTDKLDFLSLMLALFCGTASLPHILIRYYTVKDQAAARKSTVVGIAAIGFFYVLTLFLGLGAMTSGALDPTNNNMAAPLLARSFNEFMFACVSAIAFTTVLGTVSGLIMAASGAVAHDLLESVLRVRFNDHAKVRVAKLVSVAVGVIAMALGVVFEKMNVTFLVGWAFNIAASANLPALVMLLFWKGTSKHGISAAITVGMVSSLAWVLLSAPTYRDIYGLDPALSPMPFSQPGLVTIPLGFAVLVGVSLLTPRAPAPTPAPSPKS